MKRFKWPLRRLLDVTVQRELVLRGKVLALSQDVARAHQEIVRRQAVLKSVLDDLAGQDIERRIPRQEVFMNCSEVSKKKIRGLEKELESLRSRRAVETARFLKVKTSRETLERLRAEALGRHRAEQLKLEQKQLDESARVTFVRKVLRRRTSGAG